MHLIWENHYYHTVRVSVFLTFSFCGGLGVFITGRHHQEDVLLPLSGATVVIIHQTGGST